jgi:hypothetical protein
MEVNSNEDIGSWGGWLFRADAARCYSFTGENAVRNAGAICGGGFVAGAVVRVHVLDDLRDLLGGGRGWGGCDAEPCLRASFA